MFDVEPGSQIITLEVSSHKQLSKILDSQGKLSVEQLLEGHHQQLETSEPLVSQKRGRHGFLEQFLHHLQLGREHEHAPIALEKRSSTIDCHQHSHDHAML